MKSTTTVWYATETAPADRLRSAIGFVVAVIKDAMALPGEIRRSAGRCPNAGDDQ